MYTFQWKNIGKGKGFMDTKRILKIFGRNVRKQRLIKKITIENLAEKTGIRKQYLERIERGEAVGVSMGHLFSIAKALEIEPHILAEGF